MVGAAADHGKKSFGLFLLFGRESFYPSFEFVFGHVLGVIIRAGKLSRRDCGEKSSPLINFRPRAFVNREIMFLFRAERSAVVAKLLVGGQVVAPKLLHENYVHEAGSGNELDESFLVTGGEGGRIHAKGSGGETGGHRF